jgi:hypothetical protein
LNDYAENTKTIPTTQDSVFLSSLNDTGTNGQFSQSIHTLIKGLAKENKACTFGVTVGLGDEDSGPGHFGNAMK